MKTLLKSVAVAGLTAAFVMGAGHGYAQELKTAKLTDNITVIFGGGGNATAYEYDKGMLLIDDKLKQVRQSILETLRDISAKKVRFVLNTHWHRDHVGNNEPLGELDAVIVSHHNVRKRLSVDNVIEAFNAKVPATPPAGLPVITFQSETKFHLGGEEIRVFHLRSAHTDGDAAVHFKNANIIHAADVFFNGLYPFIDFESGGSIDGTIEAADKILKLAKADTKIIPGHGPIGDAQALRRYRDMLSGVRGKVAALIDQGKSKEEVIAAKPSKDFDKDWANKFNLGFTKPDFFVGRVYDDLKKNM